MARGAQFTVMLAKLQAMHSDAMLEARELWADRETDGTWAVIEQAAISLGETVQVIKNTIHELQRHN